MRVAITGASGFIGQRLFSALQHAGHDPRPVSVRNGVRSEKFEGCDAVVHLAGEPVAQRWTDAAKERIRTSRIEGTRAVVNAMLRANVPLLVSASAIGIYGSRGDEILTESSAPADDWLAQVAVDWEREADRFKGRLVKLRISLVLGQGGALEKMLPPFRIGVGGRIGNGRQWMSWIHVDDLVSMILFALGDSSAAGVWNAAAPNPERNAEFTHELAAALHRPAIFPVPEFALKMMFGEMSKVVLASQRVIPRAPLEAGFSFRFPALSDALRAILS